MGRRGPLPGQAPDNVHELPGARRVARSVTLPPSAPNPPTWLDREARAEWRRVVPVLDQRGLLATVDRATLTMWCRTWSRWVRLDRLLEVEGEVVTGYRGSRVKNPAWQLWRESAALLTALAKEIGTSPNARLRMVVPEGGEDDPEDGDILD